MPPKPDVRRLLKKQQTERNKTKKITHPFAKYDETSRLICIVCNSPVKNEAVWPAHLGSLAHRDNIQKLKALKQQQQQNLKRRAPSPPQDTNKRMRVQDTQDTQDFELDEQVDDSSEDEDMDLPNDFFDNQEEIEQVEEETGTIPTGFFDDPEEEARIQGHLAPEEQAQVDLERDLEMFNEAMIDVTKEAKEDQEQDDETFWLERHDDISREQEMFDKRVEHLKLMRQSGQIIKQDNKEEADDDELRLGLKSSVRELLKNKPVKHVESIFDDDEESESEEEDWRAQQL